MLLLALRGWGAFAPLREVSSHHRGFRSALLKWLALNFAVQAICTLHSAKSSTRGIRHTLLHIAPFGWRKSSLRPRWCRGLWWRSATAPQPRKGFASGVSVLHRPQMFCIGRKFLASSSALSVVCKTPVK